MVLSLPISKTSLLFLLQRALSVFASNMEIHWREREGGEKGREEIESGLRGTKSGRERGGVKEGGR
jgi:hypothetical protein